MPSPRTTAHPERARRSSKTRLGVWFELCLVCCIAWARPAQAADRTAFHYGSRVPNELLSTYDRIVVEPDHLTNLKAFAEHGVRPVAYLSIGEVARKSERARSIKATWVLAENQAWSSWVMDLEQPGYQAYLGRRFEELWAKGYRGFFLDTLDSYRLAAAPQREAGLQRALVKILSDLHRRHPDAQLLLNRGFEVLGEVRGLVSGVVAESLFDRWDASTQSYQRVPEEDRRWLENELSRARDQLGLPVTVIDYRPPTERAEARETAGKIAALGFEPWVTNAALDDLGVGAFEILPRRVLILTNEVGSAIPDAVRFLAPVLEYLGYVPEHRPVPAAWSEIGSLDGYQGVVTWFGSSALPPGYLSWMNAERQRGRRFVMFGLPGFDVAAPEAKALGLGVVAPSSASRARVVARDELVGFEAEPPQRPFDGPLVSVGGGHVHLRLADAEGRVGVAVASTSWGGFALSHVLALRGLSGERAWVIDPFEFLRRSLALPQAPMPNVTTYAGRRLAMIAVRPEGFGSLAGHGQPSNAAALARWLGGERQWPHSLAASASSPTTPVSAVDAAAATRLLELGFFERAELEPGTTLARGPEASLTGVSSMFVGRDPVGPIALDSLFLSAGSAQAYPFRDVLQTFLFTESPRRLKPVFLDYHGYLIGNPGGRAALGAIYGWLGQAQLFPAFVSEYIALARAFREQVVARALDGSYEIFGGPALLTLRSPRALGLPSSGPVVVREAADGVYSSFLPGGSRRSIRFGGERLATPHIVQTNGVVLAFQALPARPRQPGPEQPAVAHEDTLEIGLELGGHVPLEVELGGLPANAACELKFARGSARGVTSLAGALRLSLGVEHTGGAHLSCGASTSNG
jgi:hypothetical protein